MSSFLPTIVTYFFLIPFGQITYIQPPLVILGLGFFGPVEIVEGTLGCGSDDHLAHRFVVFSTWSSGSASRSW